MSPALANGPSLAPALPALILGGGVLLVLALALVVPRLSRHVAVLVTLAVLAAAGAAVLATAGSRRSAEASLKYVVYGGVASGAFLYGLSLLYGLAGSTSYAAVSAAVASAPALPLAAAAGLCLAGFGYKVAIVPFHMW